MPLKHHTETALMILLCLVVLVVGVLTATLPPLPKGFVPSLLLMIVSGAYALALYPFLKTNRADYEFRMLHLVPLGIVLLWFVLQLLTLWVPSIGILSSILRFGWMLPLVLVFFALLVLFTFKVLRRWELRIPLFALLLLLFTALGISNELVLKKNPMITASLWQNGLWNFSASSSAPIVAVTSSSSGVLKPGETWEDRLSSDYQKQSSRPIIDSGHSSSKPGHLPSAGPAENMMLMVIAIACACAGFQKRLRQRLAYA